MLSKVQGNVDKTYINQKRKLIEKLGTIENPGVVIAFLIIIVLFSVLSREFLTIGNLTNILVQSADIAILAIAETFIILTSGIDLSVGSSIVVASYITGITLKSGQNVLMAILIGLIFGALIGLINGLVITKGKVTPFISTMGMMSIGRGIVYVYSQGVPISGLDKPLFVWLAGGKIGFLPAPIMLVIIVAVIAYIVLRHMKIGRHIYAIGCNEEAAKLAGINITKTLIIVYVVCGLLSALSGILLTSRLNSANASLGSGMELTAIAAVVLGGTSLSGGKGGIVGSIIGAYMMASLANGFVLLGINPYWQTVVTGAIIILAVMMDQLKQKSNG